VPAREPSKGLHEEGRKVRTVVPGGASASGGSPTLFRRASAVSAGAAGKPRKPSPLYYFREAQVLEHELGL